MDAQDIETSRRAAAVEPLFYRREYRQMVANAVCGGHPESAPDYICPECCAVFCRQCANVVSNTGAAACLHCGALCRAYPEVKQRTLSLIEQDSEFGFSDLKIALRYPMDMTFTPMIIFNILLPLSLLGFPLFFAIAVLYYFILFAIKDVSAGNHKGLEAIDLSSFLAEFHHPLLLGFGAVLITFAPMAVLMIGRLSSLSLLMPAAILWAFFYYPIAMLTAGITDSFISTVNPAEG